MASQYPTAIDTFVTPISGQPLSNPNHITDTVLVHNAIDAIETKLGIDGSADATSIDYLLKNPLSINPGHKHTIASISATGTPSATTFLAGDGAWKNILKFGGTGADGALLVNSGNVVIDLQNNAVVIKNYTSISITGSFAVTFINPNVSGTVVVFKSQGAVTLTSTAVPMIDCSGLGSSGTGLSFSILRTNAGSPTAGAGAAGSGGTTATVSAGTIVPHELSGKYPYVVPGAVGGGGGSQTGGGGGGGSATNSGANGTAGANTGSSGNGSGNKGGGVLIIECNGALNFTTTSGISVAGLPGTAGSGGGSAGGGGGGGGGVCLIFYNSLTANTGTITVSGGAGGAAIGSGGAGGNGGAGYSLVASNTEF